VRVVDIYEPVSCDQVILGESATNPYPATGTPGWSLLFRRPGGELHQYVFPAHSFVARIGELGLDPEDVAGVVSMVLHEPFMDAHSDNIYAMPVEDARKAHQKRHEHARKNNVSIDHLHPVLAPLHVHHGITAAAVDEHTAAVAQYRALHAERRKAAHNDAPWVPLRVPPPTG
jgi:hypothetical protein